jgi:hypothetical protein
VTRCNKREIAATTKLPRIENAVKAGGFLTGTPDDVVEQLKAVEKRYPGIDREVCSMPLGTPLAVALENLEVGNTGVQQRKARGSGRIGYCSTH